MSPFYEQASLHSFSPGWSTSCIPTSRGTFRRRLLEERGRFEDGFDMVWGGIAHEVKSQLIVAERNMTAARYRDEILRPVAVPSSRAATSAEFTAGQCPAICS